jgi:bacteriocin-like protein
MDKKKLMSQAAQPINNVTIQDLPSELVELSEEELSQVYGGKYHVRWELDLCCTCVWFPPNDPAPIPPWV